MKLTIDPNGIWYHGSNRRFSILETGNTITQWKELAKAFSHKPDLLCIEEDGRILHTGKEYGYLYRIAEPVDVNVDIYAHPHTTMEENAEFLTRRPLRVMLVAEIGMADKNALDEAEQLRSRLLNGSTAP